MVGVWPFFWSCLCWRVDSLRPTRPEVVELRPVGRDITKTLDQFAILVIDYGRLVFWTLVGMAFVVMVLVAVIAAIVWGVSLL